MLRAEPQCGFKVLPGTLEIIFGTIDSGPVEQRFSEFRIELDRLAEVGERLVEIALSGERQAAIVVRHGSLRVAFDRLTVIRNGLLQITLGLVNRAAIEVP